MADTPLTPEARLAALLHEVLGNGHIIDDENDGRRVEVCRNPTHTTHRRVAKWLMDRGVTLDAAQPAPDPMKVTHVCPACGRPTHTTDGPVVERAWPVASQSAPEAGLREAAVDPERTVRQHEYRPGGTFELRVMETAAATSAGVPYRPHIVYVSRDAEGRRCTTFVAEVHENAIQFARVLAVLAPATPCWVTGCGFDGSKPHVHRCATCGCTPSVRPCAHGSCCSTPTPEATDWVTADTTEAERTAIYEELIAHGLSDGEARGTAWPAAPIKEADRD